MKDRQNNKTRAWELYELGRNYNERLTPSQYNLVETNTEFFSGNQWLRLPNTAAMQGLPKPVFNILKRVASLFIASLTSSGATVRFEPLSSAGGEDAARFANAEVSALLEKFKFDYRLRDALFDAAQTGDYCAHFWFDPDRSPYGGAFGPQQGEIEMELLDGINVMFGNPNDRRVQTQPYILIVGRDTVERLQAEAEACRSDNGAASRSDDYSDAAQITPDSENDRMPGLGGKVEIPESEQGTGKALYVYLYTKVSREERYTDETGRKRSRTVTTVHVTKATRTAVIYEDVDTGLSLYPIAWGNWEKQKNQYHGRALVTGLIPNQIFINSMFATAMRHLQLMAFPKAVYNADLISKWDNEIGQAIAVHGLQPGMGIPQVAGYLQGAEMSNQIFALIDKVMAYTKECLGATDVQMGNVRPDNTSALMVLQTYSEVPLENIRSGIYEWVEDIGQILLDMMGTYYGRRSVLVERTLDGPSPGQTVTRKAAEEFDFSRFKHLWLNLRVDVGATTYFSEIAMTQTLDNLRRDGTLDLVAYLERIPDKLIPRKQELIDELRRRSAAPLAAPTAFPQGGVGGGNIPPLSERYQMLNHTDT